MSNQLATKSIAALLCNAQALKALSDEWENSQQSEDTFIPVSELADMMVLEIAVLARAIQEAK